MTRAALYSRVSTTEQAKEGVSLPDQKAKLEALAKVKDWEIVDQYSDEGVSGGTDCRPELQRLMLDAKARRFDCVAVTKLDRFFRNTRLALNYIHDLEQLGIKFVAEAEDIDTSKPGIGKIILALLSAVAEWERERIGDRIRDARNHLASKGRWSSGRTPYGYRFNKVTKELEIYEPEAEVVRHIFKIYTTESIGLIRLAERLNSDKKLPPRVGRRKVEVWTDKAVRHILKHPGYKGGPNAEWKFNTPRIVEPDVWQLAQHRLSHNRHFQPSQHHFDYQGLFRCGLCGLTLRIGYNHNLTPVYECPGRLKRNHLDGSDRCTLPRYTVDLLETALTNEVDAVFSDPDKLTKELERTLESLEQEREQLEHRLLPCKKEITEIKRRMEVADIKFEMGRLDRDMYKATIGGLTAKLRELERQQNQNDPLALREMEAIEAQIKNLRHVVEVGIVRYGEELAGKMSEAAREAFLKHWPGSVLTGCHPRELIERWGMVAFVYPNEVRLQGILGSRQFVNSPDCRSARCRQSQ
jgi:site-specific DNA recombinase